MSVFIVIIPILLLWIPLIWVSVRAKPIGSLPYRWGVFTGIQTAMAALAFSSYGLAVYSKNFGAAAGLFIVALVFVLAGIGVIRRRKWGAASMLVAFALVLVLGPVIDIISHIDFIPPDWLLPLLVVQVVNILYFKKRWKLMAGQHRSAK